jgi:hypothetical protein
MTEMEEVDVVVAMDSEIGIVIYYSNNTTNHTTNNTTNHTNNTTIDDRRDSGGRGDYGRRFIDSGRGDFGGRGRGRYVVVLLFD